jgi:hypothetical protein
VLPTPENGKVVFRFNPSFADVIETFRQSVIPPPERLVDESIDYGKVIMEFHYDDGTVVVMGRNFEVSEPEPSTSDTDSGASSDSSDWRSSSDDSDWRSSSDESYSSSSSEASDWQSSSDDSDSRSSSESSDWRSSSDDSDSVSSSGDSYAGSSTEDDS